jgi:hypothetical protein
MPFNMKAEQSRSTTKKNGAALCPKSRRFEVEDRSTVKRWRDASMALRWAAAGMMEAKTGFRRLKAHRQLPALRRALAEHQARHTAQRKVPAKLAEMTSSMPTSAQDP